MTEASSIRDFTTAFRAAPEPTLDLLVGRHRAVLGGPAWLRHPAKAIMDLTGLPGWWGKEFSAPEDRPDTLRGHNIVAVDGELRPSLPMRARLGPSRVDGRTALLLTYPPQTPRFPWHATTDEVRQVGEGLLLGLSFVVPYLPPGGTPFLLRPDEGRTA